MKNTIWIVVLAVLFIGCPSKENMSSDQIRWKTGSFSDLKKKPVTAVVTNYEPNLDFAKVGYKDDFSEEAVQIVDLLESASPVAYDVLNSTSIPAEFREQIWISFSDGSGRVFPFQYTWREVCIQSGNFVRLSSEAAKLIRQIYLRNATHRREHMISLNQVKWKAGSFSDLEKEVVGVITNFDPDLNLANALYQWDYSDESLRIKYFLRTAPVSPLNPTLASRLSRQQLWIAFSDGTGGVFPYFNDRKGGYYIQSGNFVRVSGDMDVAFGWKDAEKPVHEFPTILNPWKIKWKTGSFSDLDKTPFLAFITFNEPNYAYEVKKTKGFLDVYDWLEVTKLIQGAHPINSYPDLPDQLRIGFEDYTGSIFPFFYDAEKKICYIKAGNVVRCSERLAKLVKYHDPNSLEGFVVPQPGIGAGY